MLSSLGSSCGGLLAAPSAHHDTLSSPRFLHTLLPMPMTLFFLYFLSFIYLLTSKSLPRLSERSSSTTLFVLPTSWYSLSPLQLNFSPKYLPAYCIIHLLILFIIWFFSLGCIFYDDSIFYLKKFFFYFTNLSSGPKIVPGTLLRGSESKWMEWMVSEGLILDTLKGTF